MILEQKHCMKALFSNSFIFRKLREAQQAILQFEFRIHLMRPSRYSPAAEIASGWPSKNIAQINPDFQWNHKHHFVNADCSKLYGSTGGGSKGIVHSLLVTSDGNCNAISRTFAIIPSQHRHCAASICWAASPQVET